MVGWIGPLYPPVPRFTLQRTTHSGYTVSPLCWWWLWGVVGFAIFRSGVNSQPWKCLVISKIGDRLWRANYHEIQPPPRSINSALHPSGFAKSSSSFSWGKGGKFIATGWQVTLWSRMHVISHSGEVPLRTTFVLSSDMFYLFFIKWLRLLHPREYIVCAKFLVNTRFHGSHHAGKITATQ